MAFQLPGLQFTMVAGADLSAAAFKFAAVSTTADNTVLLAGAGDAGPGVIQEGAATGRAVSIMRGGISKVTANDTVSVGDLVVADASGLAVAAVTAGEYIRGQALEGGASGELITVLLADGTAKFQT